MKTVKRLQSVIAPTLTFPTDEALYFRTSKQAYYSSESQMFVIEKDASIQFDTYFNSFSVGKWVNHTNVNDLIFSLTFKGRVLLKLYYCNSRGEVSTISVNEIESEEFTNEQYSISLNEHFQNGMIYFELVSIEKSFVKEMFFGTSCDLVRKVKLGITITTFKREKAVRSTVKRMSKLQEKLDCSITVVDNGSTLNEDELTGVTLLSNRNLGGAGGFARGLYHYKEEVDNFTHCLFMDDDASCEMESIERTVAFLEHAHDENTAIIGSMLFSSSPAIQYENGAEFNGYWFSKKNNLDLTDLNNLLKNEIEEPMDYGGWWFFAFPIAQASYPFPFFVRGDDVDFGLRHPFHLMSLNGIASWQENFVSKETPFQVYLDSRANMLHHIHFEKLSSSWLTLWRIIGGFIISRSLRYQYASAEASLMAFQDVLAGPEFFEKNIDMQNRFEALKELSDKERLKPVSLSSLNEFDKYEHVLEESKKNMKLVDIANILEKKLYRQYYISSYVNNIAMKVTLNGHLLPKIFHKRKGLVIEKSYMPVKMIFRYHKICMYDPENHEGVVLNQKKVNFFSILGKWFVLSFKLFMSRKSLIKQYSKSYRHMTSKAFWEKEFF